jgi:hypothetical protein
MRDINPMMMAIQYIVFLQVVMLFATIETIDILFDNIIYNFINAYSMYSVHYTIVIGIIVIVINLLIYNKKKIPYLVSKYNGSILNQQIKMWMVFSVAPLILLITIYLLSVTCS